MSPDDVVAALSEYGIEISRQTLLRYEWQGLIDKPMRGGRGRGKGRWTEYLRDVLWQSAIAFKLMRGEYDDYSNVSPSLSPDEIALIRAGFDFGDPILSAYIKIYSLMKNEWRKRF